jgi:hypothetical protein
MTAGIPTIFNSCEFRSRLEARWAALFTRLNWDWTYEPFDGDGYIPDFLIKGDRPLLAEVKPAVTLDEYFAPVAKMTSGLEGRWGHDILIVGADPLPDIPPAFSCWDNNSDYPPAGLIGEIWDPEDLVCPMPKGWDIGPASWFTCRACGQVAVRHEIQTWASRPCGHYDGDGYLTPLHIDLRVLWRQAGNDVRWKRS